MFDSTFSKLDLLNFSFLLNYIDQTFKHDKKACNVVQAADSGILICIIED